MTDPADLTATDAAARIRGGELTAVELVEACLRRVDEREGDVHAWAHLDPDHVRAQARARDAAAPQGPLHGVPVGVKDIIDTADLPTGYGSPRYTGYRPDDDAGCVRLLREAGAIVFGKTVTTEFATFHPGPTVNPRAPERTPGGSSSGSAAAVAAAMVPVALGTQTAGSIVRPAAFCGTWGLKPTYGAYAVDGVLPVAPSLDTLGHLARSADDLALLASVLDRTGARRVEETPTAATENEQAPRIAWAPTAHLGALEPAARERLEAVVAALELPTVGLPTDFSGLAAAQEVVMAREAVTSLDTERRKGPVSDELTRLLDEGGAITDDAYADAISLATRCRARLADVFTDVDVLLTPAVLGEAPLGRQTTGDPLLCRSWTLLGVPTVAVPGLTGPSGAPLGVQVVAAPGDDAIAVDAARRIGTELDALAGASIPAREAAPS